MTFKSNRSQLDGLELFLRVLLENNQPTNMAEKLVYSHALKAHNKVRAKAESAYVGKALWTVSLTDQEAWALHIFYENVTYNAEMDYPFEALTFQTIINQIDQEHGKTITTDRRYRGLVTRTP